jgi:hypothetical protein
VIHAVGFASTSVLLGLGSELQTGHVLDKFQACLFLWALMTGSNPLMSKHEEQNSDSVSTYAGKTDPEFFSSSPSREDKILQTCRYQLPRMPSLPADQQAFCLKAS